MNPTSLPPMCLIALMALTLETRAAFISGSINFSSAAGGGILLEDSAGITTTNLAAATGMKSWTLAEVEEGSGSFGTVVNGTQVFFSQPWIFDEATPMLLQATPIVPLWTIAGPENFTFNLISSTTVFQSRYFLAIRGTGILTANGFEGTPATWWFTTQGVAAENKFSWSSSTFAVPDGGASMLFLGASLLGLQGLRLLFNGRQQLCVRP